MRNRKIFLLVAMAMLALLGACAPLAKIIPSGSTLAVQPDAAGGGPNTLYSQPVTAVPQPQTTTPPYRSIAVTGEGRATLTPDMAYVNIGVHSENADVGEALAQNKAQSQKVMDAIKTLGVADKDIQTTNFNVYPMQTYDPQGKVTGTNYVVDNTVYVTVRNLDQLGDLLDQAVQSGANTINGIQFDVADKTSALSDARKAAVSNAETLATELAAAAKVQLGPIQSISETTGSTAVPVYAERGMGGGGAAVPSAAVAVSPGQMIITVDVNITYQIQ